MLDWSLGGCRIAAATDRFKLGDRIAGKLALEPAHERGRFQAEVVRAEESGELGLRWLEITNTTFAAMAELKAW